MDREEVWLSVVLIVAVLSWVASIVFWSIALALVAGGLAVVSGAYIIWAIGRDLR